MDQNKPNLHTLFKRNAESITYLKMLGPHLCDPYNWSQTLQYVKYTKQINIVKGIATLSDK